MNIPKPVTTSDYCLLYMSAAITYLVLSDMFFAWVTRAIDWFRFLAIRKTCKQQASQMRQAHNEFIDDIMNNPETMEKILNDIAATERTFMGTKIRKEN